jgi:hypothetical protein
MTDLIRYWNTNIWPDILADFKRRLEQIQTLPPWMDEVMSEIHACAKQFDTNVMNATGWHRARPVESRIEGGPGV